MQNDFATVFELKETKKITAEIVGTAIFIVFERHSWTL